MLNALPHSERLMREPAESSDPRGPIRLVVKGFSAKERQLLDAAVRISRRRPPHIESLTDADAERADVALVDMRDPTAVTWILRNPWLRSRVVIWVDATRVPAGHVQLQRPVQWLALPDLLADAVRRGGPAETASALPATLLNRRILVVDDNLAMRRHVRSLLEARGLHVDEADCGERAVEAAQTAPACVLMDALMPGMDGYEACRRIKHRTRGGESPAVILLTSRSSPYDPVRAEANGCDAFLPKPIEPQALYRTLTPFVDVLSPLNLT